MNWNVIQLDFEIWWVPLADENIMVEKGETWKVLSLTHVEYKVANQMSILMLVLFHHRRTILWGSCSQFTLFCLWSLSSSLPQLSLSGSCSLIYLALNLAIIKQCLSQPFVFNILTRRDLHTLTYAMGVIINYMGNYALKQVKFGVSLLNSILIFAVSGRTKAGEKRSPIWGVWDAQQPQVQDPPGTRSSFWPAILSQFMWFVSTYMALFTMFRLHHKVS